jgi:23S rRNA pseudouridine2605 synthase
MKRAKPTVQAPPVRINRYLSMCGITSRRKAELLVQEGRVSVNNMVVSSLSTTVIPGVDRVRVDGKEVVAVQESVCYVLNKPKDTITTANDERGRPTVMELLRVRQRVFPIGRLDRKTTGVLLFTNDGDLAHRLMHPSHHVPKAYLVTCDRAVSREHLDKLQRGVKLDEGTTSPAEVTVVPGGKGKIIGMVIREGWNRQVRRMFETLGYEVQKLDRVAYGPVTKEGLARGAFRRLAPAEVRALRRQAGLPERE